MRNEPEFLAQLPRMLVRKILSNEPVTAAQLRIAEDTIWHAVIWATGGRVRSINISARKRLARGICGQARALIICRRAMTKAIRVWVNTRRLFGPLTPANPGCGTEYWNAPSAVLKRLQSFSTKVVVSRLRTHRRRGRYVVIRVQFDGIIFGLVLWTGVVSITRRLRDWIVLA